MNNITIVKGNNVKHNAIKKSTSYNYRKIKITDGSLLAWKINEQELSKKLLIRISSVDAKSMLSENINNAPLATRKRFYKKNLNNSVYCKIRDINKK